VYGFVKKVGKGKEWVVSFLLFFLGSQEEDQGRGLARLVMEDQRLTTDSTTGRRQTTDAGGRSGDRRVSVLADTTTARHG